MSAIELRVERYDHSRGDARLSGMRGTVARAETGFTSSRVFPTSFPDVFVTDNLEVEVGEFLITAEKALAWLRAVADHVEARMDAS